ncbi:MAG TPA: acetate/propionate family kinase [Fimbriimonadaceae bacterium]|nr:acetate/propionate family kinase [Fimbriimonadaceae bacterium]
MALKPLILTVNGGSSSIKFSLCEPPSGADARPRAAVRGSVERIGLPGTTLTYDGSDGPIEIDGGSHGDAARTLIEHIEKLLGGVSPIGVGHRVVHGGLHYQDHQVVTDELIAELKRTQPLDLAHLPREVALIEEFRAGFRGVPQVACFDTAFHRGLPRVAQLLPIPRRYADAGIRRFGFHGLSYSYLMGELRRVAGEDAANGRVLLAHLGSGASMAAVKGGKPVDTTMAFSPTAGLVMGTRPGDLDPGLLVYLMRTEDLTWEQMDDLVSNRSGLLGLSETTYDMRDLMERRAHDARAAEAVDLFCYQARKFAGAYAAAMGGLDTVVFAGGIGEHSPEVRARICEGLEFIGLHLDPAANAASASLISDETSAVTVRVLHTDEEIVIAQAVFRIVTEGRQRISPGDR